MKPLELMKHCGLWHARRPKTSTLGSLITLVAALASGTAALAQSPADAGYTALARGSVDTLWAKLTWHTNRDGVAVATTNSMFTIVANGLNYREDRGDGGTGEWKESRDLIEIQPDGTAAALYGPTRAFFKSNLNAPDAITLVNGGRVFKTGLLGLFYFDPTTQKSIRLASVRNCSAELLAPNQVVWKSVLDSISANFSVTYTKGATEGDLVLLQRPRPPSFYGLSPATCLEVWHEWSAPDPVETVTPIKPEAEFWDSFLDFGGGIIFPRGRAFATADETPRPAGTAAKVELANPRAPGYIPVGKQWFRMTNSNTSVLVEGVLWQDIEPLLSSLPEMAQGSSAPAGKDRMLCLNEALGALRPPPSASAEDKILLAGSSYAPKGVVLDWDQVNSGTDYVFGNGVDPLTYYIAGAAGFSGAVTLTSGCVLKYAPNASLYVYGDGSLVCPSGSQAILTSRDDDLFGDLLEGYSTHVPSQAASVALWRYYPNPNAPRSDISHVRVRWAQTAVQLDDYYCSCNYNLTWSTFEFCGTGVYVPGGYSGLGLTISYSKCCSVTTLVSSEGPVSGSFLDKCAGDADSNGLPDLWEYQVLRRDRRQSQRRLGRGLPLEPVRVPELQQPRRLPGHHRQQSRE